MFVVNLLVSFLSPPQGTAAFYLKGVAPPDISLKDIVLALLPFIAIQLCVLFALLFYSNIAIHVPSGLIQRLAGLAARNVASGL